MSYIEKEKLIKADIASIENRVRHAFNQGYDLGYKEGKERAKPQEQAPTTRNCFGCKYSKDNHNAGTEKCHLCMWENQYTPTTKNDLGVEKIVDVLGSYTDLDIPYKREIAENILKNLTSVTPQEPILDKIRAEIIERDRNVKSIRSDSRCFFTVEEVLEILDKYKGESEGKE